MDVLTLFLRTVIIYAVVFIILRIMGKREIGKLSVFDLVISIMIAEIAVFVLEDTERPLMHGILPMATLMVVQIGIAFLSLKSQLLRRIFEGTPSYVIKNGKLDREEMKKHRYNLDDLMLQLRQNKTMNVADVEFAILEPSGKLTVVEKGESSKRAKEDAGKAGIRYEGLPLPLIMDGKVQDTNLEKIGQTRFWLKKELGERGVKDVKDVFFCSIDHRGNLFLNKRK
jgi:uncharacterized membrane protein YcaP (DUF421 family)